MTGEPSDLLARLDRCAAASLGSGSQKVMRAPVRLLWSKALEKYCLARGRTLRLNAETFWGADMTVVLPEAISCFLYRYGFFEQSLSTIVINHLKPGQTFFDIGTHFGYFSLMASHIVGFGGRVHCFEPTPETFEIIRANLGARPNAELNNLAVWSEETTLTFKTYGIQYSAYNSVYGAKLTDKQLAQTQPREYEVHTVTLDKYIADTGVRPDFIKMDAEGAELEILRGMDKTLAEIRPLITMEVGDIAGGEFLESGKSVRLLLSKGYKAYEFREGRLREHKPADEYRYDNILFVPSEKNLNI